jgi:hypothetical protein
MKQTLVRKYGGKHDVPRRQHQRRVHSRPIQTDQTAFNLNQSGVVVPTKGLFRRDRCCRHRFGGRPPSENGVRHGRRVLVGGRKPYYVHHIAHGERGVLGGLDT